MTREISSGSKAEVKVSFSLGENEGLRFIDIPGSVKELALKGTSIGPLIIGLQKIAYDQLHLTFDHNSLIEVFNNYKSGVDSNNIIELAVDVVDTVKTTGKTIDLGKKIGPNSVAFVPQADQSKMSYVVFNYIVGFPIKEVFINVPFFLFNDKAKQNRITVQWRQMEEEPWMTVSCVRSNGNERFGTFLFKDSDSYFTGNMASVFKPGGVSRYSSYQPRIDTLRSPHGEWSNPISPPTEKQVFSPMSRLKTASDPWGYPDIFIKIRSAETLLLPLDQKHGL